MLASLRTTGPNGLRESRINFPDLDKHGWEYYFNRNISISSSTNPHYLAEMQAVYLWAYNTTKIISFYEYALKGINFFLSNYPQNWRYTEYFSEE